MKNYKNACLCDCKMKEKRIIIKEKFISSFDNSFLYYKYKKIKNNKNNNNTNNNNNNNKPTLIFLHGLSGNHTIWNKSVEYLHKKKYSTLAIDLYGHGKSTTLKQKKRYKLEHFAKDIDSIVKHEGIKNFVIIGHCLGGMVGLVYESMFPNKAKGFVIMGASPGNFVKYQYSLQRFMPSFLYSIATNLVGLLTTPFQRKSKPYIDFSKLHKHNALTIVYYDLLTTSLTSYAYTINSMINFDIRKHLPQIKTPMLVVIGDDDMVMHRNGSEEIAKKAKNAELLIFKKTGHLIPIRKPIELAKIIEKFLEKNLNKKVL